MSLCKVVIMDILVKTVFFNDVLEGRKNNNIDVGIGVFYGVTLFSSWSKSISNPKTSIMRMLLWSTECMAT